MDSFYVTGVQIAFIIGIVKLAFSINCVFSTRAKNFEKIGLYFSLRSGTYTSNTPITVSKVAIFSIHLLILAPIFSWLSVVSAAWLAISSLSSRSSIPEKLKEVQFKVANIELTKEQMMNMLEEVRSILNLPASDIAALANSDNEDDPNTLVLESGSWYSEVKVDPIQRLMIFYANTPDYDSIFHSTFQYRFSGEKLECRLIEDYCDSYGTQEWHVRDNVILESELRRQNENLKLKPDRLKEMLEEKIKKYQSQIIWHPFERYQILFFVMGKHPELFPNGELRRIIRSDLERIRKGKEQALNLAIEYQLEIIETAEGFMIHYPKDFKKDSKPEVENFVKGLNLKELNISIHELASYKKYENDLLKLLGEDLNSLKKT